MPTISVIVPVYNVEKYIRRCVDSILGQTFTDFELILVDDGSPDGCPAICDEYAAQDSRVVVIHQQNGGLSAARNAGIDWTFENSDSQWLTFIDSDDWVHPEYLERMINVSVKYSVGVVVCGFERTYGETPKVNDKNLIPILVKTDAFFLEHTINAVIACGKLYSKSCFDTIRFPDGKQHEDEFTTYKILFLFDQIGFIPAPMYAYFQNETGIMKSSSLLKRLQGADAMEEQLAFFAEKNMREVYSGVFQRYISCIGWLNNEAVKTGSSFETKVIRRRAKNSIKKYSASFKNHKQLYDIAYPKLMYCYWTYKGIANKVRSFINRADS